MKSLLRIVTVVILVMLVLPLSAQEEEIVLPDELLGAMVQSVTGGGFVQNEDGSVLLRLEGSPESLPMIVQFPALASAIYDTQEFAFDWLTASSLMEEPLTTTAVLQLADLSIELLLADPEYDGTDFTYQVPLDGVVSIEFVDADAKGTPELPEEFDSGTLFIVFDSAFAGSVQEGRLAVLEDTRRGGTSGSCVKGWTCP